MAVFSNCSVTPTTRNGFFVCVDIDSSGYNDADFNNEDLWYSVDGGGTFQPVPAANNDTGSSPPGGDILVPSQFNICHFVDGLFNANQSVIFQWRWMVNNVYIPAEDLNCAPVNTFDYGQGGCFLRSVSNTSATVGISAGPLSVNGGIPQFNISPAQGALPANNDTFTLVWGTTPGGPYPNTVGPTQAGNGGGLWEATIPGLAPNTTYYYRVQVSEQYQSAGQYLDFGECSFTTRNLTCFQPGNDDDVHNTQLHLYGTGDNVPNTSSLYIAVGTSPGGPYNLLLGPSFPGVQGNNTVGQQVDNIFWPLNPGQTYYYRVEERDFATGGTILAAGPECSLTTSNSPSDFFDDNNTVTGCDSLATFTRNGFLTAVDFDDFPLSDVNGNPANGNYQFRVEYSTTALGPWTLAPIYDFGGTAQPNPVFANLASNPYTIAWPFNAGTQYFVRWTLLVNGIDYSSDICNATTDNYPTIVCNVPPADNITQTSADVTIAAFGGIFNHSPSGVGNAIVPQNIDDVILRYGTTPGGPYPNVVGPQPVTNIAGGTYLAGLSPGTTYYYTIEAAEDFQSGTTFDVGPECSFTTTGVALAPLSNCVTVNLGRNGFRVDVDVDTTGATGNIYIDIEESLDGGGTWGPVINGSQAYPTGGIAPNTVISLFQESGYQYNAGDSVMYRWIARDFGTNAIIQTLQCNPATTAAYPTIDCEVVGPTDPDSTQINISANSGEFNSFPGGGLGFGLPVNRDLLRIVYGTTPGGPYPNVETADAIDATGGAVPLPDLLPNTTYYYRIQADETFQTGTQFLDQGECSFTTASANVTALPPTALTNNSATLNGNADAVDPSRFIRIVWGTTPGGPYPNVGPNLDGNNTTDQPISLNVGGLSQNTNYYYVVQYLDDDGVTVLEQSNEINFLLPGPLVDPCEPATNITPFSATLNATSQNVPAGYSYRFRYGTTPGGPYPFTVSGGPSSGGSPDPYSANVAGLSPNTTYYYTSEVLDPGQVVVAGGGECSFTTSDIGPGAGIWCGAFWASGCITVDPGNGEPYMNCWPADVRDNFGPGFGPEGSN